jgi:peptidyl-prolyl cis-trans isomerase A (cyclophilin A)
MMSIRSENQPMNHARRTVFKALAQSTCALAAMTLIAGSSLAQSAATKAPRVKLTTSQGDIVVELYPDKAPKTVDNFLKYVADKHYDGTIFHRVIGTFMIQGGGFDANFVQKKTRDPVAHEGREALAKGLKNIKYTLAMARTGDPQSATAQFFINVVDNAFLDPVLIPDGDPVKSFTYQGRTYENIPRANLLGASQLWGYTVFGKVVEGEAVVDKIKALPTGPGTAPGAPPSDVPKTTVTITSATLLK